MKARRRAIFLLAAIIAGPACTGAIPHALRSPAPNANRKPVAQAGTGQIPLVFVVHPTRPPFDLAPATVSGLFSGRISNWRALRQSAAPIEVIVGASVPSSETIGGGVKRVDSDARAIATVEKSFDSIAAVSGLAVGPGVRAVSVDGHDPIADPSSYPLRVSGLTEARGPVTTLLAVGDLMLARNVYDRIESSGGDFGVIFGATAARIRAADVSFGNLEGTASCAGSRQQYGDSFAMVPIALQALTHAGFDLVTLANSHIGDFGRTAVTQTVQRLTDAGIQSVGAGANESSARQGLIVVRNGIRFGFLAFNGAGWSAAAGPGLPGTVDIPMEPYAALDRIALGGFLADVRALRARVDVLIVYPHWGQQYTFIANSDQRLVAHAIIDAGADLVVGTHPHWIQGVELYRGNLIAYSLGNFVFDMEWSPQVKQGLALELTYWGPSLKRVEFIPVAIGGWTQSYAPRFLDWQQGATILDELWGASEQPFRLGRPRPSGPNVAPRLSHTPSGAPC